MKSNVPEHIKFKRLVRKLKDTRRGVVGLLELLWCATARCTPRGDIGRFDNEAIAIECDWEGDPDELVDALTICGWLDTHSEHRLLVHDWAEHAPNYVKANLARHGKEFIAPTREATKEPTREATKEPTRETTREPTTKPSQAKPSQVLKAAAASGGCDLEVAREDACKAAYALQSALRARRNRLGDDSDWIWWASWVGEALTPGWIAEVASRIESHEIAKPKPYIEKIVRDECTARGIDRFELTASVPPKPERKQSDGTEEV